MAGGELAETYDEESQEHAGPFEDVVDRQVAAEMRAARLDAFLDRVEGTPFGSCPSCGRPF